MRRAIAPADMGAIRMEAGELNWYGLQEEFGVTAACSSDQGISVRGNLCDGLTESKRIAAPVLDGEVKMVGRYRCYWSVRMICEGDGRYLREAYQRQTAHKHVQHPVRLLLCSAPELSAAFQ